MTKHKEPSDVAILAARIMRASCERGLDPIAYDIGDPLPPILSPYTAASLAERLCAIERAQRRHAERQCSGEDGGYVRVSHRAKSGPSRGPDVLVHDPEAEERAGQRIRRQVEAWKADLGMPCEIELAGDPRGAVLKLRLPGEAELTYV